MAGREKKPQSRRELEAYVAELEAQLASLGHSKVENPLKLYLAIAAYRSLTPQTHECVVRDLMPLVRLCKLDYRRFGNDALISRARSNALTDFYHYTDCDVLVWVDADIAWAAARPEARGGDIYRIAETACKTKGIVGGVVAKRGFGLGIACRITENANFRTGTDKVLEATYVGAAFQAVHRNAVAAIDEDLPWCVSGERPFKPYCMPFISDYPGSDALKDMLSEDWALCKRVLDKGVSCHVDAMPILRHVGDHEYTIDDAFSTTGRPQGQQVAA